MVTERKIIADVVNRFLLKEYVMKATERSGFGGIDIQRNPMGTLVTLVAERPGMVIGHRGKTIKELTSVMENRFNFDNPQIEVEEEKKPNLNANIMAHKLAVALERGWHFRRAGHSTVRKIMGSGARGCQVILAGKITGERHRTEKFKEGHIKYCGESALQTMEIGYAVAKKKLGTIGIKVMIMRPDAVLPDEITILTQEQAKGIVPDAIVEELKIDTSIHEDLEEKPEDELEDDDDAAELVESLIKEGEAAAASKVEVPEVKETERAVEKKPARKSEPTEPVAEVTEIQAEPELAKTGEIQGESTAEPVADVPVKPVDEPSDEPEEPAAPKEEKAEEVPKARKPAPKKAPARKPAPVKKTTTTKKAPAKKTVPVKKTTTTTKATSTAKKTTTTKKAASTTKKTAAKTIDTGDTDLEIKDQKAPARKTAVKRVDTGDADRETKDQKAPAKKATAKTEDTGDVEVVTKDQKAPVKKTAAKKTITRKAAPKKSTATKSTTVRKKKAEEKADPEAGKERKESKDGKEPEEEGKDK